MRRTLEVRRILFLNKMGLHLLFDPILEAQLKYSEIICQFFFHSRMFLSGICVVWKRIPAKKMQE